METPLTLRSERVSNQEDVHAAAAGEAGALVTVPPPRAVRTLELQETNSVVPPTTKRWGGSRDEKGSGIWKH